MNEKIYKIRYRYRHDEKFDLSYVGILQFEMIPYYQFGGYDQYAVETQGMYTRLLDPLKIGITDLKSNEAIYDMFLYSYEKFTENGTNLLSETIFKHIRKHKLEKLINN
jgi:hypothetical protein